MIQLTEVSFQIGAKVLLDQTNLLIHAGEKVGVIGANGVGKTSLFKLLLKEHQCDKGEISIVKGRRIAHLKQEMPHTDITALAYCLQGDQELTILQEQLHEANEAQDGIRISEIHARLYDIDAYTAESRGAKILLGLGFSQAELLQPVNSFSGGWRMRLNLAQVLLSRADILLLDEPTNHLDLEAIVWLETWLKTADATLLIISHDREFLDNVTDHISHLENQKIQHYKGNFSQFERTYNERLQLQASIYEKQQAQIAHLQKFVDKNRAKASKAKQAQSRLKMIARIDVVAMVQSKNPFHFEFKECQSAGNPMLAIKNATIGYSDKDVASHINWSINDGDRMAILAPNGMGKSTFIKSLAGQLPLKKGERTATAKLKIGYFAQHQLDQLHLDESPMWHIKQIDPSIMENKARGFLGQYHFNNEVVFQPIRHFSGGEKARLALALLIWTAPNLLLLDEPTNHLDMDMRDAIEAALQNYEGAMVLISHDRHLLKNLVDELWVISQNTVKPFQGDVDDYQIFVLNEKNNAQSAPLMPPPVLETTSAHKPPVNSRELNKLETQLEKQMAVLKKIEIELADPNLYQDPAKSQRLTQLSADHDDCKNKIASLETEILNLLD